MPRTALLRDWVAQQFPGQTLAIEPASADASFRRYFRVTLPDGSSRIVMDAPPEHENSAPFVQVADLFAAAGANVPHIHQADLDQGLMLLSDLGNRTYLSALDEQSAPALYRDACAALIKIQQASRADALPAYDRALLKRELDLFPDWYIAKHLGATLTDLQQATLAATFALLLDNNLAQPQVFVHRDYHSRNLMLVDGAGNPGVLDFQDAVYGPITYDLVSLLRDAYIDWPEERELDWVIRYWEMARKAGLPVAQDFADFYRDYEWMGAQRQLKVLGIFARLCHRDGKDGYLKDMPRVMMYLRRTCNRYRELGPLLQLLDQLEERKVDVAYTF